MKPSEKQPLAKCRTWLFSCPFNSLHSICNHEDYGASFVPALPSPPSVLHSGAAALHRFQ
jgi:hypothetical protein